MKEQFNLRDEVQMRMGRKRQTADGLNLKGQYYLEHWRDGEQIGKYLIPNDITNEGKNLIFDTMFNGATQILNASWFIGLISLVGYSGIAAGDTMASHAGWTEFTGYSQANRVLWGPSAAASQSITNPTAATFDLTATGTVKGIFVCSNNTKGGTTGKLWSGALFLQDVPVVSGDQFKISYTVNA